MNKKTIALFDMDGTLTLPRMKAEQKISESLFELSKKTKIGIVTGSGYDYLIHQCESIWREGYLSPENLYLLPCNGTQVYEWKNEWKKTHSVNMRSKIGDEGFDLLMKILIGAQYTHISSNPQHPLTGHFISYRESMINWSLVGRNANEEERKKFVEYDQKTDMRYRLMTGVQAMVNKNLGEGVVKFALGGSTSVDIYPAGWDKTYALRHFPDWKCWFVGDRCEENGTDKALYDALSNSGRSYKTTGPDITSEIIEDIINRLIKS